MKNTKTTKLKRDIKTPSTGTPTEVKTGYFNRFEMRIKTFSKYLTI